MKILLDECVDWRLLRDLGPHDVRTVRQLGWAKIKNGALLKLAAAEFDVFVTVQLRRVSHWSAGLSSRHHDGLGARRSREKPCDHASPGCMHA
jgi:hypothetical protein